MASEDGDDVLADDWPPQVPLRSLTPMHSEVDRVASLEAALWTFHDATYFANAVILGDDADTTGAVCGQLAGAYCGESGIPREWLDGLARRSVIAATVDRLTST